MKVLVIGNGGREHALVSKLAQSPHITKLYCAPGNPGTRRQAENVPIAVDNILGLQRFALEQRVDLTVVGPELPLSLGIADAFAACDPPLAVFGPTQAAAQLETSKAFAKKFMWEEDIPTADAKICYNFDVAEKFAREHDYKERPLVVKVDGLAAGKGVTVCSTFTETQQAISRAMRQHIFGPAGDCVLLEQYLVGEEASFHVLVDGETVLPLAVAQDHKRVYTGDHGPNTGGMGAYSPAPVITPALHQRVMSEIVEPTVGGMAARGMPYRGVLYVGLMIVEGRPYVIEFNARFGDPETQPLLVRLHNDLLPLLEGAARGNLGGLQADYHDDAAACVVMAAGDYPEGGSSGVPISGVADAEGLADTWVFHSGTAMEGDQLVTNGGRVLGVTKRAPTLAGAVAGAYEAVEHIHWPNAHYRRDIGYRALRR
ncbi:phosphoribosylamine--glycine ligase [Candidatus Kaiserbacteria bacterium]|nr:phosphoribosylamine--glycine ligase [Candidatus Kaiserbacteria bacterium]